jgi:hypothetical protein
VSAGSKTNEAFARPLSSSPLAVPLPSGTKSERAYYDTARGTEPFIHDGSIWRPEIAPTQLWMPDGASLFYLADQIDADGSYNSAYASLSFFAIPFCHALLQVSRRSVNGQVSLISDWP